MAPVLQAFTAFSIRRLAAGRGPAVVGQQTSCAAAGTWTAPPASEARRRRAREPLGCHGHGVGMGASGRSEELEWQWQQWQQQQQQQRRRLIRMPPTAAPRPGCGARLAGEGMLLIGARSLSASSGVRRAADGQPRGGPGNPNRTPRPKKPLLEKTKELRKQLKSLTTHERIWNVPNILTFSRLIAAPVVGYLILHDQHAWALGLFAYAGITDLVDGWIARRWKLQTVVGSVVDPMADKLLMAVTVGCLAAKGALPGPLAVLIFGRDASLAVAAIYYRYASLPSPKTLARYWDFSLPSAEVHPTTVSKFNTFLQLALIGLTLLFPVLARSPDDNRGDTRHTAAAVADAPPAEGRNRATNSHTAQSPVTASAPLTTTPSPTTSLPQSHPEPQQPAPPSPENSSYASAVHFVTDASTLTAAVTALQVLVGGTTLWSGFSYAALKDAVTILGSNEALKKKQGARGRAIIGLSFAAVCVGAAAWGVRDARRAEEEAKTDARGDDDDDDDGGKSEKESRSVPSSA